MCITHINWIIFCFERKDAMKSSSSQLCPTPKKSSREVEEPKDRWDESVGLLTPKLCVRERMGGFKESGSLLQRFSTATLLCDNETTVTEELLCTDSEAISWVKETAVPIILSSTEPQTHVTDLSVISTVRRYRASAMLPQRLDGSAFGENTYELDWCSLSFL